MHTRRWGFLLSVGVVTALAACTHTVVRSSSIVESPPAGLAAAAPVGDLTQAEFDVASGVTTLVLHSGDTGNDLYRVSTPIGAGIRPAAVLDGGHVVMQVNSTGTGGPSIVDVDLNEHVAWNIHLDGGANEATVDMSRGGLAGLDFSAGVSRIEVSLPKNTGTTLVRMSGGASEFTVHAPTGVPTRVTFGGGGGSATIDGATHGGIAGGTVFAPDNWDSAAPRIDIDNTAGVSTFTLDRY